MLELLDAGLDVYTTLNIQHVESRADAVHEITGAAQQETVPDSLLDLADELELVDLTPETDATFELRSPGAVAPGGKSTVTSAPRVSWASTRDCWS